jgi:hypothetical protein
MGSICSSRDDHECKLMSKQEFNRHYVNEVSKIFPHDLALIICNYLSLLPTFHSPTNDDDCYTIVPFLKSKLKRIQSHVAVTDNRIHVTKYSFPWIYISIVPNFWCSWKFFLKCSGENKYMHILVVRKRMKFSCYLGDCLTESRPHGDCPPPDICDTLAAMRGSCVKVMVTEDVSCDYILLLNMENTSAVQTVVEKGTLHQYSLLVGCGWNKQSIDLIHE